MKIKSIPLNIYYSQDSNGTHCDRDCVFLQDDVWKHRGVCLLFQRALIPVVKHGEIEGWDVCDECSSVLRKTT